MLVCRFGGKGAFMTERGGASLEIERRFLIRIPDGKSLLSRGASHRRILQTYLVTPEGYSSERVRRSESGGRVVFTHTKKRRIARETALEEEREITEAEYGELLLFADPRRKPILKERYALTLGSLVYEIDVYPFWKRTAILEVELPDADAAFSIPDGILPIREITGERRYSNHALSLSFPPEEIFSETV